MATLDLPTLDLPMVAGLASTVIFAVSTLPMLAKAYRSRDLTSYSLGNIGLANVGNVIHSVYVFSLPPGPIWALHTFYIVSAGLMLAWYLQYGLRRLPHRRPDEMGRSADAAPAPALLASHRSDQGGDHDHATCRNVDHRCRPSWSCHRLSPHAARPALPHRRRQPADR
jgi:hypothetical protein